MSTKIAAPSLNIDAIFESAQRAHAVILLLAESCYSPAYTDTVIYSLWAVEREIREIKEAIDAVSCDEPQEGLAQRETGGAV